MEQEKEHKRRVRYKGTHPRSYREKYKELNPEKYQQDVEKIIQSGKTWAGYFDDSADEFCGVG